MIGVKQLKAVGRKVIILQELTENINILKPNVFYDHVILVTSLMTAAKDIQDEIQELLSCPTLLSDIDLEAITVSKSPSFVDYTVTLDLIFRLWF